MNLNKMYGLFLRHFYLIKSSLPRVLDLIYWPTIQIILWGFISKFFSIYSSYYSNTLGVILTCAILYDILFRSSISFNMLFLEEIWSRNFTNLFIAPIKLKEIITCDFQVVDQVAGIRPTTKDRRPFLGSLTDNKQLFFFNGLGTRGITTAPYLAKILFNFTENSIKIPKEINIRRIYKW